MTFSKGEAIAAIENEGEKVAHVSFTPDEFIQKGHECDVAFEDGCECDAAEFWKYRTGPEWLTGWYIWRPVGDL